MITLTKNNKISEAVEVFDILPLRKYHELNAISMTIPFSTVIMSPRPL